MTKKQKLTLDQAQRAAEQAIDTKCLDRKKIKRICADELKTVRK